MPTSPSPPHFWDGPRSYLRMPPLKSKLQPPNTLKPTSPSDPDVNVPQQQSVHFFLFPPRNHHTRLIPQNLSFHGSIC